MLTVGLSVSAVAQQKFELGKPNNANYRYLDEYHALKEYIDYSKYPNFKLGVGTTVNDYLNNSLVKNLTNKNFTETVAGNAMKMASCVDGNGNMNFTGIHSSLTAGSENSLPISLLQSLPTVMWKLNQLQQARTSANRRMWDGKPEKASLDIHLNTTTQTVLR